MSAEIREMLADALRKLANEAEGFLTNADVQRHGVTNCRVLELRIQEARAMLDLSSKDGAR